MSEEERSSDTTLPTPDVHGDAAVDESKMPEDEFVSIEDDPEHETPPAAPATEDVDPATAQAKQFGLADETVAKLRESGELDNVLAGLDRGLLASVRPAAGDALQPGDAVPPKPQEETPAGDAAAAAAALSDPNAEGWLSQINAIPELPKAEFDEDLCDGWNAMRSALQTMGKTLQGFETQNQAQTEASNRELGEWFDKTIAGLDPEFKEVFGDQRAMSYSVETPQGQNQEKVIQTMAALETAYIQRGQDPPGRDELFARALRAEFGDKVISAEKGKLGAALDKRSGQVLARPARSPGAPKGGTPYGRAVSAVTAIMKEKGWMDSDGGGGQDDEETGLLPD